MPDCYTALEELIYTFGGPWLFGLFLTGLLILLALVLSVARMKFVGVDELPGPAPTQHGSQIDHSFPFLESLNEVFLKHGSFLVSLLLYLWIKMVIPIVAFASHFLSLTCFGCLYFSLHLGDCMVMTCCCAMPRSWKQTELRSPRVMFIECTLWDLILSVSLGICLIHLLNKSRILCKETVLCLIIVDSLVEI